MKQQLQTYGKVGWFTKNYRAVTIYNDKRYSQYLGSKGIKIYRPKVKKARASVGGVLVIGCLVTPFTNFFIPSIVKWSLK